MNNLTAIYGTQEDRDIEGVWRELRTPEGDKTGIEMKIARWNNSACRARMNRLLRPHQRSARAGSLIPPDVVERINRECLVKDIVKGWKGVTGTDSETGEIVDVPFTEENVKTLLEELPLLQDEIITLAQDVRAYQKEAEEADAGNS